jgi:hypothetical protein
MRRSWPTAVVAPWREGVKARIAGVNQYIKNTIITGVQESSVVLNEITLKKATLVTTEQ